jgi:hypothetical protein
MNEVEAELTQSLAAYGKSFASKIYNEENEDFDPLMQIFSLTPTIKRENRQYWGRELGMLWQRLVTALARANCADFAPGIKVGTDEPIDLFIGKDAIDTKYRIGSGDSGTLKKFKTYGKWAYAQGYKPVVLILREDNLPAAIQACVVGGWDVKIGDESFDYILQKTGYDLKEFLIRHKGAYGIGRE